MKLLENGTNYKVFFRLKIKIKETENIKEVRNKWKFINIINIIVKINL